MRGLRVDFSMKQGHKMIIESIPEFQRADLEALEMKMLKSGKLNHLVPMDWVEIDGKFSFHYSINGLKMLSHYYGIKSMNMQTYYSLLLSLTDALLLCKDYLLRPQSCLFQEQFIFIEPESKTLKLTYLPLNERNILQRQEGDLLLLAVRWSEYVEQLEPHGYQRILTLLASREMPLQDLRVLLLDLIGEAQLSSTVKDQIEINAKEVLPNYQKISQEKISNSLHNWTLPKPEYNDESNIDSLEENLNTEHSSTSPQSNSKTISPLIVICVFIIGIAVIWRYLYFGNPNQQSLYISLGLTLLIGAAAIYFIVKRDKGLFFKASEETEDSFIPKTNFIANVNNRINVPFDSSFKVPNSNSPRMNQFLQSESNSILNSNINSNSNSNARTVIVPNNPPTTLISSSDFEEIEVDSNLKQPILIRKYGDEEDKIVVERERFVIGRAAEQVDYTDLANGVSRVHIEIEHLEGMLQVKDTGSRNGSLLNGHLMVPYKSYPFTSGDDLRLAGMKGPSYQLQSSR